jgi:hypothetical protein
MSKVVGLHISLQKTAVRVLDQRLVRLAGKGGKRTWSSYRQASALARSDLRGGPRSEWPHRHLVASGFKAVYVKTRRAQRFQSTRPGDQNDEAESPC